MLERVALLGDAASIEGGDAGAAGSKRPTSAERYAGERWAYRITMRRPVMPQELNELPHPLCKRN